MVYLLTVTFWKDQTTLWVHFQRFVKLHVHFEIYSYYKFHKKETHVQSAVTYCAGCECARERNGKSRQGHHLKASERLPWPIGENSWIRQGHHIIYLLEHKLSSSSTLNKILCSSLTYFLVEQPRAYS